jgi:hypothetical protein
MSAYEYITKKNTKVDYREFVGMKPGLPKSELVFNSTFECGNLDKVVLVNTDEYDLYMRTDSNTRGHNQWYYFEVSNITYPRMIRLNIVNFTKRNSLYEQGMQPCVYSTIKADLGS